MSQFATIGIENVQRQANQYLLTQQYEDAIDQLNVYPSVNAASNESIASLLAMFGQDAPSQPSRVNNSPLSEQLRMDRPSLKTMRAQLHQNPFTVPSRGDSDFNETLYTGGNQDFLYELDRSADIPTTSNSALAVGMGLNVPNEQLFLGGDNQARSAIVSRKKDTVGDVTIPESVEYRRFSV